MSKVFSSKKFIIPFSAILIVIFLSILYLLKLDSYIIKSSLSATVKDSDGNPIHLAVVCINDLCSRTSKSGEIKIKDLKRGSNDLRIQIEGYEFISETINLKHGKNAMSWTPKSIDARKLTGTFKTKDPFISSDMKVLIGQERVLPIKFEGNTFTISQVPNKKYPIKFDTPNYVTTFVDLKLEQNELGEVELTEASDVAFKVKHFFTGDELDDFKIKYHGYNSDIINSRFQILIDAKIDNTETVTLIKPGFAEKEIILTDLKQGKSEKEFFLAPEGKIYFISDKEGFKNIYESNYDGSGLKNLTPRSRDNFGLCFKENNSQIQFLSTRENIRTEVGFSVPLLYSLNLEILRTSKLTKNNYSDFKNIGGWNCENDSRIFYQGNKLYLGNSNGTDTKVIYEHKDKNNFPNSYEVANDKATLFYTLKPFTTGKTTLNIYDINAKTNKQIFETEKNIDIHQVLGEKVYFSVKNTVSSELYIYVKSLDKTEKLFDANIADTQPVFVNNKIYYLDRLNAQTNLKEYNFENKEIKVILEKQIGWFYFDQTGKYILYSSEGKLWIVDPNYLQNTKEVFEKVNNPFKFDNYFYL